MNLTSIWMVLKKYVAILVNMKRTKWSVGMRNTLSSLAMECDSVAAIENTKMSNSERETLQKMLFKAIDWIDSKIK